MKQYQYSLEMPSWEDMKTITYVEFNSKDGWGRIDSAYSTRNSHFDIDSINERIIINHNVCLTRERWESFLNGNIYSCYFNEEDYNLFITTIRLSNGQIWHNPFCVTKFS